VFCIFNIPLSKNLPVIGIIKKKRKRERDEVCLFVCSSGVCPDPGKKNMPNQSQWLWNEQV